MARQFPSFTAFLLMIALALMPMTPAFAKIGPEGQKELETIFSELLDQYRQAAEANGAQLVAEGNILVEPSSNYYAVTLPHITLKEPGGAYTEIGMIAINALPGDTPEQWNMTVALPTPIIHYDSTGTPLVTVTIGGQNFAGVWHRKFKNFVKMNARYSDIGIKQHAEQTRIVIPDLTFVYDLQESAKGLWSGPASLKIGDFQMYFDADGASARIKEIGMVSKMEDYSLEAAMAYQENISAFAESMKSSENPRISGRSVIGFYNLFFDFLSNSWNGFDFDVTLKDFSLTRPPIPGSPPGVLKIANGRFGFGMAGLRTGKVNLGLKTAYDGFELAPVPDHIGKTAPDHLNLDLSINNLPFKEIVDLGRTSLQSSVDNPAMGQMAGLQAIAMIPQLLTQAQTNVTLGKSTVGNEHYDMAADALFTANMGAVMGATGALNAQIYGIDNLINGLNAAAADPNTDAEKKKSIQDTLATLAIVKMVGQMGKDDKGRDVRTYKLELNEQGQTLLNGTDLQMLLQATQGGQAPAKQP